MSTTTAPAAPAVIEQSVAALTHGRYLLSLPASGSAKGAPVLIGFHGYGENAESMLAELRRIPGADEWVICSIAALHRFYRVKTGEIVGSWMTKQDREQMIEDNVRYVTSIVMQVLNVWETSGIVLLAGFSQGAAQTYRTASSYYGPGCSGMIILAGDVPPEIDASILPPILIGRGTQDEWYSEEKMKKDLDVLEKAEAQVETCIFDAGHVWTDEFREAAGRFLVRIQKEA